MVFELLGPYILPSDIYLQRFLTVFLWSFWSSSTLPRLVCLAYVPGFHFLFCCVEVSSVVLRCNSLCCVALLCVLLYLLSCIALCCVELRCDPLRCVALPCTVLHC